MRPTNFLFVFALCLFCLSQSAVAQTIIFSDPGGSYTSSDGPTNDPYGPVSISNCSSISFSVDYNFSQPWVGVGNMDSSNECVSGNGCAGDPTQPLLDGCNFCWDFLYVQFQIDGANVNTQLIGVPGSLSQSGTLTFGPICTGSASTAGMIIQTQTWASDETITFSNVNITCWDGNANLSVNPDPACSGAPFTLTATPVNAPSIMGSVWSGGAGTITSPNNLVTTVTGAPAGTHTFTFTATDDNACTESSTIDVVVGSGAGMDDPANENVCSGNPVNVGFTGTGSQTFNWTNSNTAIGLGASGTGDLNFTAATVMAVTTATITVTPSENGCVGPSQTFTITVNPLPTANQPTNVVVCGGLPVNVSFSGTAGATFDWTNDNTAIGLGASGSGNISFTSANGSNQEVANITVTPIRNGCPGTPVVFTVTVNPTPSVFDPPNSTVCAGSMVEVLFAGLGNPTFNWANSNSNIGLLNSGSGDISFTAANVGSPTTGTITVTPTANGCPGPNQTFTITVNPVPGAAQPSDVAVCGGLPVNVTLSGTPGATFNWTNDNTAIGLGASGNGSISFTSANVSSLEFANISVTPVIGMCPGPMVNFSITVNPAPNMTVPGNQTVCSGATVIVDFMGNTNPTFNWTNNNTAIGLGASGTGDINFVAATVGAPVTSNLTVTPSQNGCNGATQNFTLTVTPAPSVNQPNNVAACGNNTVNVAFSGTSGATFNWTNSNTAIGLGATGSGDISFVSAGVSVQQVANLVVTPVVGTCTGTPVNFSITINPSPTVTDPPNQSVCIGGNLMVTFTGTNNPTFNWTNNNTAIGLGASGTGNIDFNGTGVGTGTVTVTPTANGCPGPSQDFDISVVGAPIVDPPPSVAVCTADTVLVNFTGTSGATFSWVNSDPTIGLGASGTGNLNFVAANVTAPTTATITVTPSLAGCTGNPQNFQITVNPLPTITVTTVACAPDMLTYDVGITTTGVVVTSTAGTVSGGAGLFMVTGIPSGTNVVITSLNASTNCETQQAVNAPNCNCPQVDAPTLPNNPVICDGDPIPALTASVPMGVTIDWYTAGTGGTLLLSSDTSYTPTGTFGPGMYNFFAEARDTTSDCTSATRLLVTLTVNPRPSATQLADTLLCAGATVVLDFTGTSGATFNWTNSNTAIGLAASGSGNLNFNATNTGSGPISGTIVATPSLNGCTGPVMSFLVTVSELPSVLPPSDQTVCAGIPVSVNFTGTMGAVFNWTNSDPSIGLSTNGTGNISFVAGNVTASTTANLSVTPTSPQLGCSAGAAQNFTLTVNPTPSVSAPASPNVCPGVPVVVSFAGTAGAVFNWTNSNTSVGLGASGTGDINFISTNSGASTLLANVSVTPLLNTCPGTVQNFSISVVPQPTIAVSNILCASNLMTYSMSVTSNANMLTASAGTVTGSSPNFTVTGVPSGTNVVLTATNTVASCSVQQSVTAPNCTCPTIMPPNGPNFPVICEGTATPALMVNVGAGITVDWYATPTGGAPLLSGSTSFIPPGMFTAGSYIFYAESREIATGCTSTTRTPVFLTVNAAPTMTQPIDQAVCAGFVISVGFNGTNGALFNWTNSNPAIGLAASGAGNISFSATNTGLTPLVATITVTPTLFGCNGQPRTFTITVNPAPSMTDPADVTACVGQSVTVNFSGTSGATFSWTNSNAAIGLAATGSGNISFNTTSAGNATIVVIPMANGCSGTPQSFNITSLSNPTMNNPGNTTTCAGANLAIAFTGTPGLNYAWTNSNPAIGLPATGSGNISFVAANVTSVQTAQITVTPQQGACFGQAQTFNITINPLPVVSISGALVVCNGDPATLTAAGGSNYSWSSGQNTASISVSPSATTIYTVTVTTNTCASTNSATVSVNQHSTATVNLLTCDPAQVGTTTNVIPNAAGCDSTITTITSLDIPGCTPSAALTNGAVTCFGNTDGILSLSANGGLAPYQYTWSNGAQMGSGQITAAGSSIQITNLPAGNYSVTVTAANGLSITANGQVTSPTVLSATATPVLAFGQFALSCNGSMDASINAVATGGTAGYQYAWSVAGQTAGTLTGVGAGTYEVTVTDANQCRTTVSATITDPPALAFDIVLADVACGESSAVATITPLGGASPFDVELDGLAVSGGLNPSIPNGTHLVQITDANGCTAEEVVELTLPIAPAVSLPTEITITLGEPAVIDAVTNLSAWSNIEWTPLPDPACPQCLRQSWIPDVTRDYTVVVTDTFGCSASATIRVLVRKQVDIYVPNVFSPNLDGLNDNWTIDAGKSVIALNTLQIFDRWGEMVYFWDAPVPVDEWPGWDGNYKGERLNPGVYVYYFEVLLASGETLVKKGDLTLLR